MDGLFDAIRKSLYPPFIQSNFQASPSTLNQSSNLYSFFVTDELLSRIS